MTYDPRNIFPVATAIGQKIVNTINGKKWVMPKSRVSPAVAVKAISTFVSPTGVIDNNWRDIVWSSELGLFAAVSSNGAGNTNRVMTSPDGVNWTIRITADEFWYGIAWAPELGIFAAVNNSSTGNRVMTSPNGINWTRRTTPADNSWKAVVWAPELSLFVAVADSGTGNRVMTSPNGITWNIGVSPVVDRGWYNIAWSPELNLFVAVGGEFFGAGYIMTSSDGFAWTERTSASLGSLKGVAWSPELSLFVAVGGGPGGGDIVTSSDGITWAAQTSPGPAWYDVAWGDELGLFIAVSNNAPNNIATSPDGINWTMRTSPNSNNMNNVAWSPELGIFATTGDTGSGNRVTISTNVKSFYGLKPSAAVWTKYIIPYTSFTAAALTQTIEFFILPAKGVIEAVMLKSTTAFSGPSLTAYAALIGIAGDTGKYSNSYDVFAAVNAANYQSFTASHSVEDFVAATSIKITATSVGANLNTVTAGALEVYVKWLTLP